MCRPSLGVGEGPSPRGSLVLLPEGGRGVSEVVGVGAGTVPPGRLGSWELGSAPGLEAGLGQAEGGGCWHRGLGSRQDKAASVQTQAAHQALGR